MTEPRCAAAQRRRMRTGARWLALVLALTCGAGCRDAARARRDGGMSVAAPSMDAGAFAASRVAAPDAWPDPGAPLSPTAAPAGTLTVRLKAEPAHLNIMIQPDHGASRVAMGLVFEPLLGEDPASGGLRSGVLVYPPRTSNNGLQLTFSLAPGRTWHDGRRVTLDDVKWTLDTVLDPKSPATTLRANLQSVRAAAVRDGALVLELKRRDFFALRALTTIPVLPRHVYGEGALEKHPANRAPIGSGPYRFASWTPGRELSLTRSSASGPPFVKTLRFLFVRDDAAARLLVQRGELDVDERAGTDEWLESATDAKLSARARRLLVYPPGYAFRVYNTRHPALADVRVRRALTLLTDRDTVLREVHRGLHRGTHSPYPIGSPCAQALSPHRFDPVRATALLREAGYGPGAKPLRLTWLIPSASRTLLPEARIFQADARRAGVDVALEVVEWAAFQARLREGRFELAALAWFTGVEDDFYAVFHSTQGKGGLNYGAFADAKLDRLLDAARTTFEPRARLANCRAIAQRLHDTLPYTFMYQLASPTLLARRVGGARATLLGLRLEDLHLLQ